MSHTIRVLPAAEADIRRAVRWMTANVSDSYAVRWRKGVRAAIESLKQNPRGCPVADEAHDLGLNLRFLLFGRRRQAYRILFTYDTQTVVVRRILHAAQDHLTPDDL